MKKASDDLFRLIKSLTKSEKGFFKKFAARNSPGGRSNYISLFDAIESMETYDDETLKKKLQHQPFANQIPVYKVYLFNLILKALQQYGSYENTDSKLADMVAGARILAKKQMPREAQKILKKAKEIAYKFDNEKALLEILFLERNILMVTPDKHVLEKRRAIYEEHKQFIERLKNRFHYTWLSDQMVMFVEHSGDIRNLNRKQEMEKIVADTYMQSADKAKGFTARMFYYHTFLFYYIANENMKKMHEVTREEILFQEQHRHFIDENPSNYVNGLLNYLLSAHLTRNKADVMDALRRLALARRQYRGKLTPDLETQLFLKAKNTELVIYADNCETEKGKAAVKTIETDLKKYRNYISPPLKITLYYNSSHICFLDGDFDRALYYINKLLNESEEMRSDVYNFAKLYNLILHYELKNYDHLEYITENTYRYLKDRKSLFKVEELVINAIRKALNTTDKKDIKSIFEDLTAGLKKTAADIKSRQTFEFFDFISWAESKVIQESYAETKKRKLNK